MNWAGVSSNGTPAFFYNTSTRVGCDLISEQLYKALTVYNLAYVVCMNYPTGEIN